MEIDERTVEVSVSDVVTAASYDEMEALIVECYGALSGRKFVLAVVGCISREEAAQIATDCGVLLASEE